MLRVRELVVNHLREAIGLDEPPRFSWKIGADERGFVQREYRLQIAANPNFAAPAWDSGWVNSDRSVLVPAPGFEMAPARAYFARVSVVGDGEESGWSMPLRFVSGLCGEPWTAKYVAAGEPLSPDSAQVIYLRGTFNLRGAIREAYLFCSARGAYVPYVNGLRAGEDLLAPGWVSARLPGRYQTYEVSSLLRGGQNVLGAMLGPGWREGASGGQIAFLAQLLIRYVDGRELFVDSDESWLCGGGPVISSDLLGGEVYDARRENPNWCKPGPAPADWKPVRALEDKVGALESQPGGRIRCRERLRAARMLITARGERVVDFGRVVTGWPEFALRGVPGRSYRLRCLEALDASGNIPADETRAARPEFVYTCRDKDEERHHPEFALCGFRYVQLADWPFNAQPEDFTAWVIHSDMPRTGSFECSEPLLNGLHRNILRGQQGGFLDLPMSHPCRGECLGWVGDGQIFSRTASCLMDVYGFYRKWLRDVCADQTPEGELPLFTGCAGEGANLPDGWEAHPAAPVDAIASCAWNLYLVYGDSRVIEEQYEPLRRRIDRMRERAEDGILLPEAKLGEFDATPDELIGTACYARSAELLANMAKALGRAEDAEVYGGLHDAIADKFRRSFLTPEGDLTARTRTAHALALRFNLLPPELRERAAARLAELSKGDGEGFALAANIALALAEAGRAEDAYELLLRRDENSWLRPVEAGAATAWEWPGGEAGNPYAYGAVGELLYRVVAGLDVASEGAGYHRALLRPRIGGHLQFARAAEQTPYGELACGWELDGDTVRVNVRIPANASAVLTLPDVQEMLDPDGAEFEQENGAATANLTSGEYRIIYRRLSLHPAPCGV